MKLKAIALDETKHWTFAEEDVPFIEKMFSVYCYEPESHTYLCESTPSLWLEFLYHTALLRKDTPEEVRERINERYELLVEDEGGCYMHENKVELLKAETKEIECEDFEDGRSYFQGNYPF